MQSVDVASVLPGIGLAEIFDWLARLFVATLRIGAFLLASPVFGGRFVQLPVRIVASVVLALPVAARLNLPPAEQIASLAAVPMLMGELAVGLVAGLVLTLFFAAASMAGDRIASTAGLGFAAQFDPSAGGQTPVVSTIFGMFLLSIFLASDGHLAAIRILIDSYTLYPPGNVPDLPHLVAAGVHAGGSMFALGLSVMMPVVGVLTLLNFAIGVITRSAPQLNIFAFGFPITMTATLLLLYLTAPATGSALQGVVEAALVALRDLLAQGGNNG